MKNVIILLLASIILHSCSVMKKHKTFEKAKIDSTAIVHKAVEVKTEVKQSARDTTTTVSSKTITNDIDTSIYVPGHVSTATLLPGDDETVLTPAGDTISIHVNKDRSTTVRASTPHSYIPIKVHNITHEADTVAAYSAWSGAFALKTDTNSAAATNITSKSEKETKTKDKTVFSLPWYLWLILILAVIIWLVWKYRKRIFTLLP